MFHKNHLDKCCCCTVFPRCYFPSSSIRLSTNAAFLICLPHSSLCNLSTIPSLTISPQLQVEVIHKHFQNSTSHKTHLDKSCCHKVLSQRDPPSRLLTHRCMTVAFLTDLHHSSYCSCSKIPSSTRLLQLKVFGECISFCEHSNFFLRIFHL